MAMFSRPFVFFICCPILRNCGHCGEPEQEIVNRITGGSDVEPGSHPWAALLVYTLGRGVTKSLCGGALINLQTVLTAAHCIEGLPRNWRMHRVRLGEWNVDNLHSCKNIENGEICNLEPEVRRAILHDHYNRLSNSHLNDIALLQLAEKVTISKYIKPICLPLDKTIQLMPIENEPFTVVGWGETENAQHF
ncbi:AAEL014353-PA [Aedes aegypti]|uniref:AAEL014353-PA n=1 Tax=Aedes aegypti TaxID=7159 RepID=Q16GK2_AEDAE|nr:AAEL014353-PA [Aedes aegypti]